MTQSEHQDQAAGPGELRAQPVGEPPTPAGGELGVSLVPSEASAASAPEEVVDGLPVVSEVRELLPAAPAGLSAVQAAAAATTGFVAGAATLALLQRRTRRLARTPRSVPRRALDMLPVVGTRTFVVDVHLLAKPGE